MPSQAAGLYDPRYEHDACGVGMVARLDNVPTHEVVTRALTALENLEHRGASGADPLTGDGAGILMQMPDELLRARGVRAASLGAYGVFMCFLPTDSAVRSRAELLEDTVAAEGQRLLGWRKVPVCPERTGTTAGACRPEIRQLFVGAAAGLEQDAFERKLYVIRRVAEKAVASSEDAGKGFYVASSSSRTINYKGMLISYQLGAFYPDLRDERCKSALALVHSRFSTNTFPSWELAHPYRVICHNGEINTVMGNVNWMRARESELATELFGEDLRKILPVVTQGNSDSATFDNVLELLMLAGRSLPHAVMMMIPEAYRDRRTFGGAEGLLRFPLLLDGAVGRSSVGRVHRWAYRGRHTRPQRSAARALGDHQGRACRARLGDRAARHPRRGDRAARAAAARQAVPGRPERGRVVDDGEVKRQVSTRKPYGEWYARNAVRFARA